MNSTLGDRNISRCRRLCFRARRRTLLPLGAGLYPGGIKREREPLPLPLGAVTFWPSWITHSMHSVSQGLEYEVMVPSEEKGERGGAGEDVEKWGEACQQSCCSTGSSQAPLVTLSASPSQAQSEEHLPLRLNSSRGSHMPSCASRRRFLCPRNYCTCIIAASWGGGVASKVHNSHEITAARCSCKIKMVDVMTTVIVNSRWRIIKGLFLNCRLG